MTNIEIIELAKRKAHESEKVKKMVDAIRSASAEELKEIKSFIRKEVARVKKHKKIIDLDIFNIMIEQQSDPRINIFDFATFMIIDKII